MKKTWQKLNVTSTFMIRGVTVVKVDVERVKVKEKQMNIHYYT